MIFLGELGPAKCIIEHANSGMHVTGSREAFLGYKMESSSGPYGVFAEWKVENDTLNLSNDEFGFFPLYYFRNENSIGLSSSLFDLLDMDASVPFDDAAIAVFLRMGSFVGNSTPFKNIKALPPGATLQYEGGHFHLDESRRIKQGVQTNITLGEAQGKYGELFQNAIEKFRGLSVNKIGVPLSAGRDSRHILFALMRAGMTPYSCLTMKHMPPNPDEDANVANVVSSYVGVNHIILDPPVSVLDAERTKNMTTNLCSLEHSWILPLSDFLAKETYGAIFDGIGGDVLSAGLFLTKERLRLYQTERLEELAEDILGDEGYLPKMITKSAYKRFSRDLAIDILVKELKRHVNSPNPVGQFYFWNRTRRHIAMSSWRLLAKGCYVFAPYLEHELYRFLSSLPAEYLLDHTFHTKTISMFYPEYSHLPYKTQNAIEQKHNYLSIIRQLAKYLWYLVSSINNQSMVNRSFIYLRILKAVLSPQFYNKTSGMYRMLIYVSQLAKYQ